MVHTHGVHTRRAHTYAHTAHAYARTAHATHTHVCTHGTRIRVKASLIVKKCKNYLLYKVKNKYRVFLLKSIYLFGKVKENTIPLQCQNKMTTTKKTDARSPGATLHLQKIVDGCQPILKGQR